MKQRPRRSGTTTPEEREFQREHNGQMPDYRGPLLPLPNGSRIPTRRKAYPQSYKWFGSFFTKKRNPLIPLEAYKRPWYRQYKTDSHMTGVESSGENVYTDPYWGSVRGIDIGRKKDYVEGGED